MTDRPKGIEPWFRIHVTEVLNKGLPVEQTVEELLTLFNGRENTYRFMHNNWMEHEHEIFGILFAKNMEFRRENQALRVAIEELGGNE